MSALKFKLYSNQAHNSNLQEVLPAVFVLKTEATQCKLKKKEEKTLYFEHNAGCHVRAA